MTLDKSIVQSGFWTSAIPEGFSHSLQILAAGDTPGLLQPGETVRVPFYYAGWQKPWDFSRPPIYFSVTPITRDSEIPLDWSTLQNSLRPDAIPPDAWQSLYATLTTDMGDTFGEYVAMLSRNAVYLHNLGVDIADSDLLVAFEMLQAQGIPVFGSLAADVDAAASAPESTLHLPGRSTDRSRQDTNQAYWDTAGLITGIFLSGFAAMELPKSHPVVACSEYSSQMLVAAMSASRMITESLRKRQTHTNYANWMGQSMHFRPSGELDYVEDTNGNRISCIYLDDANASSPNDFLLTALVHSSGVSLTIHYNDDLLISSVVDDAGRETTYGLRRLRGTPGSCDDVRRASDGIRV